MDLAAVFRKVGGNFIADESVRQVDNLQRSLDAIMVGDSDELHATTSGDLVDFPRLRVTLRSSNPS